MKVKLLKKVRKRFEIIRYDQISYDTLKRLTNYDNINYICAAGMELPIYFLKDKRIFSFNNGFYQTQNLAKERILRILKEEKVYKLEKDIKVKVWHINS